jgi:hypothetical protein
MSWSLFRVAHSMSTSEGKGGYSNSFHGSKPISLVAPDVLGSVQDLCCKPNAQYCFVRLYALQSE